MRKKIKLGTLVPLVVALASTSAAAAGCGDWSAGVDTLYWQPVDCNFLVGYRSYDPTNPTFPTQEGLDRFAKSEELYVQPGFDWGVRPYLSYQCGCQFVRLSYLWYDLMKTTRFGSDGKTLIPSAFNFSTATPARPDLSVWELVEGKTQVRYQNLSLRAGHLLTRGPCESFVFGVARWVDISESDRELSLGQADINNQLVPTRGLKVLKTTFQGGGAGAGFGGRFTFCDGFALSGEAALMGIFGTKKTPQRFRATDSPATTSFPNRTVRNENRRYGVGALDVRAALGYGCQWSCLDLQIDLGYELHFYWHALAQDIELSGEGDDVSGPDRHAGYGGPTLGLTASF